MQAPAINLIGGWLAMLAGVLSGSIAGLLFHDENWLGGYSSFRRRLARLGHISFFGLGFVNLLFAATAGELFLRSGYLQVASVGLIVGAITMPICCYLTAWKKPMRHLFPIPVVSVAIGIAAILAGWWLR